MHSASERFPCLGGGKKDFHFSQIGKKKKKDEEYNGVFVLV